MLDVSGHPISASVAFVSRPGGDGTSDFVYDYSHSDAYFDGHSRFDSALDESRLLEVEPDPDCREALLDPTGTTSHSDLDDVERARWESGIEMAGKLSSVGLDQFGRKLRECHTFWSVRRCSGCFEAVRFWNRCDLFWCPQCAPRLAKMRLDGLMQFVESLKQVKHLVLTFRNVSVLSKDYLRSAVKSLQKFRRRSVFKPVRGGLWAMEITNEGRGWHVHFHLVIDSPWLAQKELVEAWKSSTPDGSFIVHISDANRGSLKKNLPRYVTKYAGKGFRPHSWSADELGQFVTSIQGVRTFGVFGVLLGRRKEVSDWLKTIRRERSRCQCGCTDFRYFSELEWWMETELALPPPKRRLPEFDNSGLELPLQFHHRNLGVWAN